MSEKKCYFCTELEKLEKHHIIPQEIIKNDVMLRLCPTCHVKVQHLINPIVRLVRQLQENNNTKISVESILPKEIRPYVVYKRKKYGKLSPFTEHEDNLIKTYYNRLSVKEFQQSKLPHRTLDSIRNRAKKLNIFRPNMCRWHPQEISTLQNNWNKMTLRNLQRLYFPHRTIASIQGRLKMMGLIHTQEYVWSNEEETLLREHYQLSDRVLHELYLPRRSVGAIIRKRKKLGLKKDYRLLDLDTRKARVRRATELQRSGLTIRDIQKHLLSEGIPTSIAQISFDLNGQNKWQVLERG